MPAKMDVYQDAFPTDVAMILLYAGIVCVATMCIYFAIIERRGRLRQQRKLGRKFARYRLRPPKLDMGSNRLKIKRRTNQKGDVNNR